MTRCRVGDLVVIVLCDNPENLGKVGRILRQHDQWEGLTYSEGLRPGVVWETDINVIPWNRRSTHGYVLDSQVRPIRPGDISDEEVRDLYAPNTTKETV